jgi:hypothetical protein
MRYCLPHSSIMLHQPSGGYFGQATDIAIHAREILRVRGQLNGIYKAHLTGKGKDMSLDVCPSLASKRKGLVIYLMADMCGMTGHRKNDGARFLHGSAGGKGEGHRG